MAKPRITDVRQWLTQLLARQPVTMSVDEAKAKIALLIPSFQQSYDSAAFTQASLDAVGATLRFFREADIREALDAWCRANLTSADGLPPEIADLALPYPTKKWMAFYLDATSDKQARRRLDLIRQTDEEAYSRLLAMREDARRTAYFAGWTDPNTLQTRMTAEWSDPAAVRRCLATIFDPLPNGETDPMWPRHVDLLRAIVGRWAPQHLGIIARSLGEA